jgi:proteasome accessory factor A
MKPFLMGCETEYAVSGSNRGIALQPGEVHNLLCRVLQEERCWLADAGSSAGIYLENGGRFYLDYGQHPEYATPECFMPAQVACHDKAGEQLLQLARSQILKEHSGLQVRILKNNLSSLEPDTVTWGTHESYTCWTSPEKAADALVPHLVTRIIYAGAGCLSAYPGSQGFELSQRVRHLVQVLAAGTTSGRALFCSRTRKASDRSDRQGWFRAHLIGKDSQRAPFGTYLTFGTTGLLFLLLNAGCEVGKGLALQDPLRAARAISCDPWLHTRVLLVDGRWLTALEIQEAYLAECEREVANGNYPLWAAEVIRHWRVTLQALAHDPLGMACRLDPYCKLLMYQHELRRAGYEWGDLRQGLEDLACLRRGAPPCVIQAVLSENLHGLAASERALYEKALQCQRLAARGALDRLRLAVRLQVLDLVYHELGGLFDELAAAGRIQNLVLSAGDIAAATLAPPPGGRAEVRGECIRSYFRNGWIGEWRFLYQPSTDEFVDLRNPFSAERNLRRFDSLHRIRPQDAELQEIRNLILRKS